MNTIFNGSKQSSKMAIFCTPDEMQSVCTSTGHVRDSEGDLELNPQQFMGVVSSVAKAVAQAKHGQDIAIVQLALDKLGARHRRLVAAVEAIYYAAHWTPDRPVDETGLWTELRDAASFIPGGSPIKIEDSHDE